MATAPAGITQPVDSIRSITSQRWETAMEHDPLCRWHKHDPYPELPCRDCSALAEAEQRGREQGQRDARMEPTPEDDLTIHDAKVRRDALAEYIQRCDWTTPPCPNGPDCLVCRYLTAEDALAGAVALVEALHRYEVLGIDDAGNEVEGCSACGELDYPCGTIAAIKGGKR
jgi:hypothetical protein